MRGYGQGLTPGQVIGQVAVETMVVARREVEQLLVRAAISRSEHFHSRREVGRDRFSLPLAND